MRAPSWLKEHHGLERLNAQHVIGIAHSPTEGWETRSLYSAAKFINGAAFKNSHFCDPSIGLPVVKIAELKSGITDQTKFSNRTDLDTRYQIDTGDMLYSWSGSPDTSLDTFIWTKGPGLLNQHIFRVITESGSQKTFVYYLLKHLKQDLIEIARNKQTTGLGHVTIGDMQRLMLTWPDAEALEAFHEVIGPLLAISFNAMLESEKLATLRDYLLPRLLSGRVLGLATTERMRL
jgi:type I restriction enzyme S subunit